MLEIYKLYYSLIDLNLRKERDLDLFKELARSKNGFANLFFLRFSNE